MACKILVHRPGIEPTPPAVDVKSLNLWTPREFPSGIIFCLGTADWHRDCVQVEKKEIFMVFREFFILWSDTGFFMRHLLFIW